MRSLKKRRFFVLSVLCPECNVSVGKPCRTPEGKVRVYHETRMDLACDLIQKRLRSGFVARPFVT